MAGWVLTPVPMRDAGPATLAPRAAAAQAGHLGCGAGFIGKHELRRVELGLEFEPGLAPGGYVFALLLAGMSRLFLYLTR